MWREKLPKLEETVFAALDTETTGLLPAAARLVEVAAVRFDCRGEVLGEFGELVNPGEPMPSGARLVHGITDAMVAGVPPAGEVVARALEFMAGDNLVMVAHNAPFDLAFLAAAMARAGLQAPDAPVLDTRVLAMHLLPKLQRRSLDDVAGHLGLEVAERHRALPDAHAVRRALIEMLAYLRPGEFEDLPRHVEVFTFADADITPVEPPAGFEDLAVALEEGLDIDMIYSGGSMAGKARRVKPLALYRHGQRIYLAAYDHTRGLEKTYRLDRIEGLRLVRR
jgi:DNA polymerase-3 subunit epsilon